jgi:ATP-dependent DNA ligase
MGFTSLEKRTGLWRKYRVNLGQEFLIGGYTAGNPFDAIIIGFYRGKDLIFAGRIRAGFVPATRREVFAKIKGIKIAKCPFANLPEREPGRWGQGLTAEKMKSCIWVKPETVVRVDFAEWTADKLRHTKFVALRDDKRIRHEAWGKNTKLIALSSWGRESDRRQALLAGFDHHLTRPIDPDRHHVCVIGFFESRALAARGF